MNTRSIGIGLASDGHFHWFCMVDGTPIVGDLTGDPESWETCREAIRACLRSLGSTDEEHVIDDWERYKLSKAARSCRELGRADLVPLPLARELAEWEAGIDMIERIEELFGA